MKKFFAFTGILFLLQLQSHSQFSRYIVYLKDKGATTFTLSNPLPYLSQRAIDRRTRYSIQVDSADLPIPASYISQIQNITGVTILNTSRWFNAIAIDTTDPNAIAAINALPFVKNINAIAAKLLLPSTTKEPEKIVPLTANKPQGMEGNFFDYGTNSFNEIHLHKGEFLHNIGLRGQGMQIALIDGGFFNYTTLDAMDSAVANGQILSTWDFVNRESSVVEDNSHGMMSLSTIAANIPGQFIGKAPKASFHLYKTEDTQSEYPIEEFNWVCAAERADSSGTDVISSSLGYNTFDDVSMSHTYADMNGNTTIAAIGADIAAKKGLIVFNANGNYGLSSWHYLATPADGDSVVSVGAVSSFGNVLPQSSFGPSSDNQVKPDVASVGAAAMVQAINNTIGSGNGTSFACPNMAGLGTCLWQAFPEYNNMRIIRALREASSQFNTPDDRIGYGIPDMRAAFTKLLIDFATVDATIPANSCTSTITWTSKDVAAMRYEIERKTTGETNFSKIATVDAKPGLTLTINNYQFNDVLTNAAAGQISYRIRQIVDTSTAEFTAVYIDTADIMLTTACTTTATNDPDPDAAQFIILPNPATSNALLSIQTRYAVPDMPIMIYNMKGQLIMNLKQSKPAGKTLINLPIDRLSPGRYSIKIYNKQRVIGSAELLRM